MPHKSREARNAYWRKWKKAKYANNPRYRDSEKQRRLTQRITCKRCQKIVRGRANQIFCSRTCTIKWMWEQKLENRFLPIKNHRGKYQMTSKHHWPQMGTHKTGQVYVHRIVMANHLNRPLLQNERVHHLNGDKSDNRLENLVLMTTLLHAQCHMLRPKVVG